MIKSAKGQKHTLLHNSAVVGQNPKIVRFIGKLHCTVIKMGAAKKVHNFKNSLNPTF